MILIRHSQVIPAALRHTHGGQGFALEPVQWIILAAVKR